MPAGFLCGRRGLSSVICLLLSTQLAVAARAPLPPRAVASAPVSRRPLQLQQPQPSAHLVPVSLSQLLWAPSTSLSCPSSLSGNATCLASPGQLLALSAPPASALLQFPSAPVLAGTPFHVAVRLLDAAGAPIMPSVPLLVTLTVDPLSPAALAPPVGSLAVVFAAPGWADFGLSVALSAPQAGALAGLLTLSFAQPPLLSVTASVDVAACSEGPQSTTPPAAPAAVRPARSVGRTDCVPVAAAPSLFSEATCLPPAAGWSPLAGRWASASG